MIDTIFCDVDGVVADLSGQLTHVHGFDTTQWPRGEWSLAKVFGKSDSEVWDHPKIKNKEFWATLPLLPWAEKLVSVLVSRVGRDRVCFLTQPVRDSQSLAGKSEWIRSHFPRHPYLIGYGKDLCARNDALLIDDSEENIHRFRDAGGRAILFPRIWNSGYAIDDSIGYVLRAVELLT